MRTCKTVALMLAALAAASCDAGFNITRSAPARIELPDGTVVAGAQGWCIDTATTRAAGSTAVVVLGSCAAIAGNTSVSGPGVPGVVTIAVESEAGDTPTPEELESFFVTEQGRAALARDGQPESVEILETRHDNDLLYLHSVDRNAAPGASPDTWRALFNLDGRFVSVSLFGLADRPIGRNEGLAALEAQVDELKTANDN